MADVKDTEEWMDGVTVATFESRMSETTAELVEKYGGTPVSAPSMQEVPLESHEAIFDFGEKLFGGEVDLVLFNTGVGARMLVEALETRHPTEQIVQALTEATVIARGPKPVAALGEWDVPIDHKVPEPNTWREILSLIDETPELADLSGRRIAVQEYGRKNQELLDGLEERGADVLRVPIYRWELPEDTAPLRGAIDRIIGGDVEVAVFTSRHQVTNMLQVARQEGKEETLRRALGGILVASVGPVTSEHLREEGIEVDFEPERPKLGVLMRELAEEVARTLRT